MKSRKTDIDLPMEHPYYRQFVYDTVEGAWYNRNSDMFIDEEERLIRKLPTKEELMKERSRS